MHFLEFIRRIPEPVRDSYFSTPLPQESELRKWVYPGGSIAGIVIPVWDTLLLVVTHGWWQDENKQWNWEEGISIDNAYELWRWQRALWSSARDVSPDALLDHATIGYSVFRERFPIIVCEAREKVLKGDVE